MEVEIEKITFKEFKTSLKKSVDKLISLQSFLFITDIDKDEFYEVYLSSFPESLRQEFTCNACRSFIRQFAGVVAINDNKIHTMWDFKTEAPYDKVVESMKNYVLSKPIVNIYMSDTKTVGIDSNRQTLADGTIKKWEHMHYTLPQSFVIGISYTSVEAVQAEKRELVNVFRRSIRELTLESVDIVLELISSNSLYRGEEFKFVLTAFRKEMIIAKDIPESDKEAYFWKTGISIAPSVARIRNTAIGTLLIDLSEDMEIETAVSKFERNVMAPTNYKRPNALITKKMIEDAESKIKELGFEESLTRRFATKDDIKVNDILFMNRDSVKETGIFGELKDSTTVKVKSYSIADEISIDKFINDVIPLTDEIEILVEGSHESNLMSLIAPVNTNSPSMFNWENGFSWSYNNALADSMKEKVKSAGGKVEGFIRCSLEWFNYDDLDLHLRMPNGEHISYRNKIARCGIALDVDANGGSGSTRTPVENIIFPFSAKDQLPEGIYNLEVHQFSKRESVDTGYNIEIEHDSVVHTFSKDKSPINYDIIASFTYTKRDGFKMLTESTSSIKSREIWNINTNNFHKVSMIMNSPNHWDGESKVGNKHYFFMIDGLKNQGVVRGMFNEFLKPELLQHKKVFEAIGSKMKVESSQNELSGLGFSSTLQSSVICKVKGKSSRVLKIKF